MKRLLAAGILLVVLFNNCSRDIFQMTESSESQTQDTSITSFASKNADDTQYLAIVEHWNPAGPESFVSELVQKLPRGTDKRKLAFAWVIDPLQTSDTSIEFQIKECFRVAEKYHIPFILHVNHEWLFPGREINGDSLITQDIVEWTDWNRNPLRDWWSDWSVAFEGKPTRFPPRLSFNSPQFLEMNRNKAQLIKKLIGKYGGVQSPLFVGIDTGWETGIEYDYQGQLPAYNALIRNGFSAQKPPADLTAELAKIASEYVKQEIGFYSDAIPAFKLFTHILIYDGEKGRRQPTQATAHPGATPGFSLDINSDNTQRVKSLIGNKTWAITESWRGQASAARTLNGEGLPAGLRPPSLVVLYTWGVDIRTNNTLISQLSDVLKPGQLPPPADPPTPPTIENRPPKGSLDIAGPNTIEGWAFDPDEPSRSIEVHLYFDTAPISGRAPDAIITANASNRLDINNQFGITGAHGFIYTIPSQISPRKVFAYALDTKDAARTSTAISWDKAITQRPTPPPSGPNVKPKGYLDIAGPTTIEGWAFDPNAPAISIDIHFYFNTPPAPGRGPDVIIKASAANRLDINTHFGLTGSHGIYYVIPSQYKGKKVFIYAIDTQDPANMSEVLAYDRQL